MSLQQGSTGRLLLQIAQTAGTIVATAYGGPVAGLVASAGHAAFFALYDSQNADGTVNRQESIADLRLQTSTLGQAIPQVFGNGSRLAGNIIWATDKVPHEHRETQSSGGKGGPENVSITKTYTISLAIALCDTRISGQLYSAPLRAWKNANLIADVGMGAMPNNWTFYAGTADQLPDPTIEAHQGVGQVPGYRYLAYIVMTDEDLGPSGQLPQWSFEIAQSATPVDNLDTIVTQLCGAAGLTEDSIDVTGLPVAQVSLTLASIEAVRASMEQLALAYRFYGLESGMQYVFRSIGAGGIVVTIPEDDGSAGEDQANEDGGQLDRAAPLELPTLQYLTYVDPAQNYQRNTQPSPVILPPSGRENPKNITTALALSADQARHLSTELVALAWVQREPYADVLPRRYCYLEPGDKVNAVSRGITYPVTLAATTYGAPGLVEITGRVNGAPRLGTVASAATVPIDQTVRDATTIPPGAVVTPGEQTPQVVDDTTPVLLNLPVLDSSDQAPRYHVAYVGANEPWEGGVLYRSVDGSATFQQVDAGGLEAITGTVAVALATVADFTVLDTVNTFSVVLEYGELATINATANAAGVQRVMVGSEMVYVGTATLTATRTYTCSQLWRGRQGSEWAVATHGTNEVFVLLDSAVHRIAMTTAERGISYPFKAVTRGQSIADATPVSFTPTAENLIPWQVTTPVASRPVQTWQFRWYERSRFVPGGRDPDFIGFLLTIYDDATFTTIARTIQTTGGYPLDPTVLKGYDGYTAALQVLDFGSVQSTLYWSVAQVGAYAMGRSQHITSTDTSTVQGAIDPGMSSAGGLTWVEVTAASQAMQVGYGYVANRATLITFTLPATAVIGDMIEVAGLGAGGWKINQNASQKIHVGRKVTTTGVTGSIASRHVNDTVKLVCVVPGASTEWDVDAFA